MKYTPIIQKAIKFSVKTHELYQKQKRKGKDIAYITHPLSVGLILSLAGASEEVIAAGILHDTIEDSVQEKKVTHEMIVERFGENVAQMVQNVTEDLSIYSWVERKQRAIDHICSFNHDSLLVKSADVISNVSEILDDYNRYGDEVFARFSVVKEMTINHYIKVIEMIINCWKDNPLCEDLEGLLVGLDRVRS